MSAGAALPEIDTARIARICAALAGSPWADAAGREAAALITARFPAAPGWMRHAREFHARAALRAVTCAARGVIFAAAGYPVRPAMHEAAAAANPDAAFAYAAACPVVTAIRDAMHGGNDRVAACTASACDPEGLLAAPEIAALPRPLHLQIQMALHFWEPRQARSLIRDYGKLLPPGSVLLLTWVMPGAACRDVTEFTASVFGTPLRRHAPGTVAGWLDAGGFTIMPPGIRDVRGWRLDWPELRRPGPAGCVTGVIARAG